MDSKMEIMHTTMQSNKHQQIVIVKIIFFSIQHYKKS